MWIPIRSGIPATAASAGRRAGLPPRGARGAGSRAGSRPADVAERLGRDADRRRLDDASRLASSWRSSASEASERPSMCDGADAVARVAEARSGLPGSSCRSPAGGSARRRSARPRRARSARPRAPGRSGPGGARPRATTSGSRSAWPCSPGAEADPAAAPAERDPPVGGGAEVVDHRPRVGDALAPGPADLLEQVRHRLGDHDVARGHRQPVAHAGRCAASAPPVGEHRGVGAHPPAGGLGDHLAAVGAHATDRACARRPRRRARAAARRAPGRAGPAARSRRRVEGAAAEDRRGAAARTSAASSATAGARARRAPRRPRRPRSTAPSQAGAVETCR